MRAVDGTLKKELAAFAWVSALSLLGGCALVAVRFVLTDRFFYFFLLWNLALALVPYGIAVAVFGVSRRPPTSRNLVLLWLLSVCWLLFYPNAPYIFTDFIHVVNRTWIRGGSDLGKETLLWYDLVLCSAVAFMGHSAGLMSIDLMMRAFKGIASRRIAWILVGIAVAVSGFGLYVGRFVRFNSWDILIHPIDTAGAILPYLWNPRAILLSSVFSAFILITYAVHHLSRKSY
jgi:uncharacterized membrane protein